MASHDGLANFRISFGRNVPRKTDQIFQKVYNTAKKVI